jgi:hypothetical protein
MSFQGTTPHRSVRARLRIRLLPRMRSGEAGHGIRMQNAGSRNPTAEERIESVPSYLSTLTAADKHGSPQPADATAKHAQLSRITWDSGVLVGTQHNSAKPSTDLGRAMMLTALQLSLDGFELGRHSLLRRDPPDDEGSIAVALPAKSNPFVGRKQRGVPCGCVRQPN